MAALVWDKSGERLFETGLDHGVLFNQDATGAYPLGIAWNGLISMTESPSGAEATPLYADNIKYLNLISAEEFGGTLEAYMHPKQFNECIGILELEDGVSIGQQARKPFGFAYRTKIGNDTVGQDFGYKIHIIYGALVSPSETAYNTINDSPEAAPFSWTIATTPVAVTTETADGVEPKPTATLVLDSTVVAPAKMAAIEKVLFGDTSTESRLPLPDEIVELMNAAG